jgi:hypothetical protein
METLCRPYLRDLAIQKLLNKRTQKVLVVKFIYKGNTEEAMGKICS